MKQGTRYVLTFLIGAAVGGMLAAFLVGRRWQHDFANWYVAGIAGQALTAREIYRGQAEQTADQIRGTLPGYVLAVENQFRDAQGRESTYWLIRDVYESKSLPLPEQIKGVLSSLPPRASCKPPVSRAKKNGDT